jgi:hypothetical protein
VQGFGWHDAPGIYNQCCLPTTIQPDTPPTFKPLKHQIQS